MISKVIRTREEAEEHNPNDPALVEVPGELVRKVLFLVRALETKSNSKRKKKIRALLSAVSAQR